MERQLAGRYRLGAMLGRGPLGEVVAGTGPDGHEYAVKLLDTALTRDQDAVAGFLRAQSPFLGLVHENLVSLHDLVVEAEVVALVVDRVTGGSLRDRLAASGTLLPAEIARIGAGIAAALHVVHEAGVVHGDVKPSNVLMDDSHAVRVPKLTDTGLARLAPQRSPTHTSLATASKYAAPEVVRGEQPGPAADLYSLGVVLYELYCGVAPFAGGFVRDPGEGPGRPGEIPAPLWDLVRLLLAVEPTLRPRADQVAGVLTAMTPDLVGAPVGQRLDRPPPTETASRGATSTIGDPMFGEQLYSPPPKKRKKWVPVVAAVAVLAAAGVTTVALTSSGGSPTGASPVTVTAEPATATVTTSAPTTGSSGTASASASAAAASGAGEASVEQYLDELRPVTGSSSNGHQTGNVAGKAYLHTVAAGLYKCSEANFVEYNISKGYRKFTAAAGMDDNSEDSSLKAQLEVFGDGKKLLSTTLEINKLTPVDLDVTGVLRLKIGWQPVKSGDDCRSSDNYLDLGEAKLLGVPGEVPTSPMPTN
jgi:serine/threonine protein kinase